MNKEKTQFFDQIRTNLIMEKIDISSDKSAQKIEGILFTSPGHCSSEISNQPLLKNLRMSSVETVEISLQ